jgi:uncharacterized protein (DUF697 family)
MKPRPDNTAPTTGAAETAPRHERAQALVRRNVYWALGLGLLPFPLVDVVALTGVQVKMIAELSALYDVKFSEERARTAVVALTTGLGSVALAGALAGSLFKLVPVLGVLAGAVGVPVFAGALTHALGNLFVMHYESGGTLLSFDADRMRDHFRKEFEQSKIVVTRIRTEAREPAAP